MSKGPGFLGRRIVEVLWASPEGRITRRELQDALTPEGFEASNILRSLRSLHRQHVVYLDEKRTSEKSALDASKVYLLLRETPEPVSDEKIGEILKELTGSSSSAWS